MLRITNYILVVLLCLLEYRFWLSSDSVMQVKKIKQNIVQQQHENANLLARNGELKKKIAHLKKSPVAIEEQARYELGLVKRGEKYYQVVEPIE